MALRAQLLRLVQPDNGGPRSRRILDAYACRAGKDESFIQSLIAEGVLVQYGNKKGTKWGIPARSPRTR